MSLYLIPLCSPCHWPEKFAGMIHRYRSWKPSSHKPSLFSMSGSHSSISKLCDTTLVPGFNSRNNFGLNLRFTSVSKKGVTALASFKFTLKKSPLINSVFDSTQHLPILHAFCFPLYVSGPISMPIPFLPLVLILLSQSYHHHSQDHTKYHHCLDLIALLSHWLYVHQFLHKAHRGYAVYTPEYKPSLI